MFHSHRIFSRPCFTLKYVNIFMKNFTYKHSFLNRPACPERSKTKRGSEGPGLALLAGANRTDFFFAGDFCTSMLLFAGKMFKQGN
jgi:hypothetical protein